MPKASKTDLKPASTEAEIITPGQPSTRLLAALRQIGGALTDESVFAAYRTAETRRAAWQTAAIELGLLILAKKQTLKHGQFQKWAGKLLGQMGTAGPISDIHTATRQLRKYAYIAQHFLADLEQGKLEAPRGADQAEPLAVEELATLATLPHSRRMAAFEAMDAWVRGRSLRQMLADLRRAVEAGEAEEAEENPSHLSPAKPSVKEHAEAATVAESVPPPVPLAGEQLTMWDDFARPIHTLDTLLESKDVVLGSSKELWRALETSLSARLDKVRSLLRDTAA